MKPREKGGVVDSKMNVYGTKGLKIADLSICPENLGTNTYSVRRRFPLPLLPQYRRLTVSYP
jgi:hypothetical protein